MKKTVEIEYVGIEDVQDIMDLAFDVTRKTNHYVGVEMSNYRNDEPLVKCYIILGGFDVEKEYDYKFSFYLSEDKEDVEEMYNCKEILEKILDSEG